MSRVLSEFMRLKVTGKVCDVPEAVTVEYTVLNGDLKESPQQMELTNADFGAKTSEFWNDAVSAVRDFEKLSS